MANFPLSDKLMQNYLNFLIKNTEYAESQGRIAVQEVIKIIIEKFPDSVVNFFADILFATQMVNCVKENDKEVLDIIQQTVKILLGRVQKERLLTYLKNSLSWIKSSNDFKTEKIQAAGFVGLQFLFQHAGELLTNSNNNCLADIAAAVKIIFLNYVKRQANFI